MSARILDGRSVAERILEEIRAEVQRRLAAPAARAGGVAGAAATPARGAAPVSAGPGRPPCLSAVLVGDDPASQLYVRNKVQAGTRCGIESRVEKLPASASEADVVAVLERLNADSGVDGILVQLPLPAGLPVQALLSRVEPRKDVDGLHPVNLGKLVAEDPSGFLPCTPAGIVELLLSHGIDIEGRQALVLGRSVLVGKPLALLLMRHAAGGNATVTVAHSRSRDLPALVRRADLVVAAVGQPRFVRGEWLRPGATVVDVGVHRVPAAGGAAAPAGDQIVGDVDFASAVQVAGAITPVPGGVGRVTVAMLMRNTLLAWRRELEA